MAAIVLDTTVVIDLLKGLPEASARFVALDAGGDTPHVCAITVEEVSAYLRRAEREAAGAMFEGLALAPLGIAEGRLAGWWRRTYRERGKTISQADALIAAAAIGVGARLATGNPKDFPMKGLIVEHWPVGE